jgi:hypothetical protein
MTRKENLKRLRKALAEQSDHDIAALADLAERHIRDNANMAWWKGLTEAHEARKAAKRAKPPSDGCRYHCVVCAEGTNAPDGECLACSVL